MTASYVSLGLARFDQPRTAQAATALSIDGMLGCWAGADTRAAGSDAASQSAYKFVLFGLHASLNSAVELFDRQSEAVPWWADATENWKGVLRPIRHLGEANFLDREHPAALFDCPTDPAPSEPFVVLTTAGFEMADPTWLDRAKAFGTLVGAVRIAMTGLPGLHSQQSFFFGGGLERDGLTVTFWKDFAATRDFAYGPGIHRDSLMKQREGSLAHRTSFTRLLVERSEGTWHGSDPLVF